MVRERKEGINSGLFAKGLEKTLSLGEGVRLHEIKKIKDKVNAWEDELSELKDEQLAGKTGEFRNRLKNGETLDDILPEAFAVVRETSRRVSGERHFDVQIMAGAALHQGDVVEMKTGEGKTLVATTTAYLNALTGKGFHVVTVNDYLVQYQSELMRPVYERLGLSVGAILNGMHTEDRKKAYDCDVTYGTANQFGFDYLRDNMAFRPEDRVQRGHNFALVDEVDSILIDDARTPLIISGPTEDTGNEGVQNLFVQKDLFRRDAGRWFREFARLGRKMQRDVHYEVDEKKRTAAVLEEGIALVEDQLGIQNLYETDNTSLVDFMNNAIKAKELYRLNKEYIVRGGEVLIVDENTGRVLDGRRFEAGMHESIEAKEGVEVLAESSTWASITLQNYFRLYDNLAGMTGTAKTEESELCKTYKFGHVLVIPSNKPNIRKDNEDLVYITEESKFRAIAAEIKKRKEKGQPVLVGTVSIEKSELLSELLTQEGIGHEVLNAKLHEKEAKIIAQAGRKGAVTVATNMAGRGVDIKLGGDANFLAEEELTKKGFSKNDEEYSRMFKKMKESIVKEVTGPEHKDVVAAGGLCVIGTERHDSRRIDNQLRGRAGRQGDPGESVFYLSLDDSLLRKRISETMANKFKASLASVGDEELIQSRMMSRAIESAQSEIEGSNYEMRKNVLKYDDVMKAQREVVYTRRREMLESQNLRAKVLDLIEDVSNSYVSEATQGARADWDLDKLWKDISAIHPLSFSHQELEEQSGGKLSSELIGERVREDLFKAYEKRAKDGMFVMGGMNAVEKNVLLRALDKKWREHQYEMGYLKEGIGLRAMAQRDPLVEYQNEGAKMFSLMASSFREEAVKALFDIKIPNITEEQTDAYGKKRQEIRGCSYIREMTKGSIGDAVDAYVSDATSCKREDWDLEKLWNSLAAISPLSPEITKLGKDPEEVLTRDMIKGKVKNYLLSKYDRRVEEVGPVLMENMERKVSLSVLDAKWADHLEKMNKLISNVENMERAGKVSPVGYFDEAKKLFESMILNWKKEVPAVLFNMEIPVNSEPERNDPAQGINNVLFKKPERPKRKPRV